MFDWNTSMGRFGPEAHPLITIINTGESTNYEVTTTRILLDKPDLVWDRIPCSSFISNVQVWQAAWATLEREHGAHVLQKFWARYASESADGERSRITAKALEFTTADQIIYMAEYIAMNQTQSGKEADPDVTSYQKEIANWIIDCIQNKKPAPLRALANEIPNHEYSAQKRFDAAIKELKTRLLYQFCHLLQDNRALPTRRELEGATGIDRGSESGSDNFKNVSAALRSLGLDALPE